MTADGSRRYSQGRQKELIKDMIHNCVLEFLGTMVLVLMGNGVCAATTLNKSKAQGAGWVAIALGWGLAVMCGVFVAHDSGAHLNPAVSVGLAAAGLFDWTLVLPYATAQMLGGFAGQCLVWLFYKPHFDATADSPDAVRGCFCTAPAVRHTWSNLFSEAIATFVLILCILCIGNTYGATVNTGASTAFPVTFVIMSIGFSLGATTGYAMNAARDLAPRIAYFLLPVKGKGSADWSYSWIPVVGPIVGAVLAAAVYLGVY